MWLTWIAQHITNPEGKLCLFSSSPWQTTTFPCKTPTVTYSKYMSMFWAQLDRIIFNSQDFYMLLIHQFTCLIQRIIAAYIHSSPFCGPPSLCVQNKRKPMQEDLTSPTSLAAGRCLRVSLLMFSSRQGVKSWGCYMSLKKVMSWFLWTSNLLASVCHAVVLISATFPKPLSSVHFSAILAI